MLIPDIAVRYASLFEAIDENVNATKSLKINVRPFR